MIVLITYENYPDGSPGAIRNVSLAKAYNQLGYRVTVLHKGKYSDTKDSPRVISLYNSNHYKKYYQFGKQVLYHLNVLQKQEAIEAVIIYSLSTFSANLKVQRWCTKNNILCIYDVVEWYSKEQIHNLSGYIAYTKKNIFNRLIITKKQRVIAISSYLENYFSHKGCKVVRIPIIKEKTNFEVDKYEQDVSTFHFTYAGSHLLMDNIPLIIKAIAKLNDLDRKRIIFTIYGLTEQQVCQYLSHDDIIKTKNCVRFMGCCSNDEVLKAYKNSHFTILLRNPQLRVNQAGFPSKVVESLSQGVPVLCNYSSDLHLYLENNKNASIVDELQEDSLVKAFRTILQLEQYQILSLRQNAIRTVNTMLNYESFNAQLKEIIS